MSKACHERMRYVHAMNNAPPQTNFKNFFTKRWEESTLLPAPAYLTTPGYCSSYAQDQAMRNNYLQQISPYPSPSVNAGVPQNACIPMRGDN